MSAPHITLDYDAAEGWVIIHSTYAAKEDIRSFNGWRKWDPDRRKWRIYPVDAPVFRSHMKTLGYVVHDPKYDAFTWADIPGVDDPSPFGDL